MSKLLKLIVMGGLTTTLGACTTFDPYQVSGRMSGDLTPPVSAPGKPASATTQSAPPTEKWAGGLAGAMSDVSDQRSLWFDALGSQSKARATTAATLIGLGTVGIVGGLRAGVASESVRRNLALAGGLSAGAYSSFNFFSNEVHEKAYLDGIVRLTCAIAEMRPLMVESSELGSKDSPSLTTDVPTTVFGEAKSLDEKAKELDGKIATFTANFPIGRNDKTPAGRTLDAALDAAYLGRGTQRGTSAWLHTVHSAGFMLRREAELIVARTSALIQANQNKVDPKALAADISSITKAYRDIKIDPADTGGASTPVPPKNQNEGDAKPPPAALAAELTDKAKTPIKDADTATLLEAALQRLQKQNTASVDAASKAAKEAQTSASEAKQFANQSAGYCTGVSGASPACSASLQGSLNGLATATSALYAARRPLSNRLANFNAMRKSVRELPGCGTTSAMTLSPNGDATVAADKAYEISIQNPEGMPALKVSGPAKGEIVLHGSLFVARITPTGTGIIKVTVTDTKGGSDEVDLTVK